MTNILCRVKIKHIPFIIAFVIVILWYSNFRIIDKIYEIQASREVSKAKCPHAWIPFRNKCYKLTARYKNFKEAQTECQNLNSNLPIIRDKETQDFLVNFPYPPQMVPSNETFKKMNSYIVNDPVQYRNLFDQMMPITSVWLGVTPVQISNFTGIMSWIDGIPLDFTNYKTSDPLKGLIEMGFPYVTAMSVDKIRNDTGIWFIHVDLGSVCGACFAVMCEISDLQVEQKSSKGFTKSLLKDYQMFSLISIMLHLLLLKMI